MISVALVVAALQASALGAPARADTVIAPDTVADRGPRRGAVGFDRAALAEPHDDTTRVRHRAVEYSDWYARRLTIHRWGSYVELPLFAGEYVLGQRLINGPVTSSDRGLHRAAAGAIGGLFVINTVTGAWNLWDSRHDEAGRTRRWLHSGLMFVADAGFVATGAIANRARTSQADANRHRDVALGSMAVASASTLMMWLWKE